MSKQIIMNAEARAQLKSGADKLADAVKVTLGAGGKNVGYMKQRKALVTKDGVTVAKVTDPLSDNIENIGAKIIREASEQTMRIAGDGTTTTIVLAQAMIGEGCKLVTSGYSPIDLNKGIELAVNETIKLLKEMSIPIGRDKEKISQVAAIAANNNAGTGELIADAFDKVGVDGEVILDESKTAETTVSVVKGLRFDRGFVSLDLADKGGSVCELYNPLVFIYDGKISVEQDIFTIGGWAMENKRTLLIIADDVEGRALTALVSNKVRGLLSACAVRTPHPKREYLEDISAVTGATIVTEEKGMTISNLKPDYFGFAERIEITKEHTTIIGGGGTQEKITERIDYLKKMLAKAEHEYQQAPIRGRIAKLAGGIAQISVGGQTEAAMKEQKDLFDDAIRATKAAIEEGIVIGGGMALLRCASALPRNMEYQEGVEIVRKSLFAPFRQIVLNTGMQPASVEWKITDDKNGFGFNAKTMQCENLLDAGIIDPTKVVRVALEKAASVATMLLTCEGIIAEK